MNEDSQRLERILAQGPRPDDLPWAESMLDRYPYFTLPAALTLSEAGDSPAGRRLAMRVALASADPAAVQRLADPASAETPASIYPQSAAPAPISTDGAISTFLDNYGHQSPEEDALLERLILNPVPDYAQLLDQEERSSVPQAPSDSADPHDRLIDNFIIRSRQSETAPPAPAPSPIGQVEAPTDPGAAQGLLSESLAKIYIKQRRYDRAYEIISQLSLNFPKKSAYFADQLRFLRKLILNQQYQQQQQTR